MKSSWFLLMSLGLIAGCSYLPFIQKIPLALNTLDNPSRFISYYVVHNAPDHLALAVKYYYAGTEGECVQVGAIMLTDGVSDGFWAYRPDPVKEGEHWARIVISQNQSVDLPAEYTNNAIQFEMYRCGDGVFAKAEVPFVKKWRKLKKPQTCHSDWGHGCGG